MGVADVVPGVSGGTVAFILGFYEQLIFSVKNFNWRFLVCLIAGIATSILSLASIIHHILGHEVHRVYLYSTFLGLVLAASIFCAKQIKHWKWIYVLWMIAGVVIAFNLTKPLIPSVGEDARYSIQLEVPTNNKKVENYNSDTQSLKNLTVPNLHAMMSKGIISETTPVYDQQTGATSEVSTVTKHQTSSIFNLWIIICGCIGVCAMLLPGISGSYLLVVLGMYSVVLGALVDLLNAIQHLSFDLDAFLILANLGIGIIVGAALFSRVVSWLLVHHHNRAVALLTGFMLGALRAVWPFNHYLYFFNPLKLNAGPQLVTDGPYLPAWGDPMFLPAAGFAITGFTIVFLLEKIALAKGKSS